MPIHSWQRFPAHLWKNSTDGYPLISISQALRETIIGCYECHALRPEHQTDSFEHNGHRINMVVRPGNCAYLPQH